MNLKEMNTENPISFIYRNKDISVNNVPDLTQRIYAKIKTTTTRTRTRTTTTITTVAEIRNWIYTNHINIDIPASLCSQRLHTEDRRLIGNVFGGTTVCMVHCSTTYNHM